MSNLLNIISQYNKLTDYEKDLFQKVINSDNKTKIDPPQPQIDSEKIRDLIKKSGETPWIPTIQPWSHKRNPVQIFPWDNIRYYSND